MFLLFSKTHDHYVAKAAARLLLGLALVATIGIPSRAGAEDEAESEESRSGPYFGAAFTVGFAQFDDNGALKFDTAMGANGWIGYRLFPRLAAEFQVEYLNGLDSKVDPTTTPIFEGIVGRFADPVEPNCHDFNLSTSAAFCHPICHPKNINGRLL